MPPIQSKPYAANSKNHQQGKKNWNDFAQVQGAPPFDECTIDQVAENNGVAFQQHFREFAGYLSRCKKQDKTHYTVDAQLQYLSNAKAAFSAKFKEEQGCVPDILNESSTMSAWYTELRVSIFVI
jgi:AraC-like DNA-binding protein